MRFFHLSDLHIGRHLHGYSLLEQQKQVLGQVLRWAEEKKPDAIVIAGDIYDKVSPSGEAVLLFDWFLTELSLLRPQIPLLLISGNHDSSMRLKYASELMKKNRIYVAARTPEGQEEHLQKLTLTDGYGPVHFYLLPYVRPRAVRMATGEIHETGYQEAVAGLLARERPDWGERNVLISHQFYTAGSWSPSVSDSESIHVGGLDNVDIEAVRRFDYVALGHLHSAQKVKEEHIRYCGSPMKYSVSEWKQPKGILLVTLGAKGEPLQLETLPLKPDRDVVRRRGTLEEVLSGGRSEDFISVTLTDEKERYQPREILEEYFPFLLEIKVENSRTRNRISTGEEMKWEEDPMAAFEQFFQEMQGRAMRKKKKKILEETVREAGEEEV